MTQSAEDASKNLPAKPPLAARIAKSALEWLLFLAIAAALAVGVKWWMARSLLPVDSTAAMDFELTDLQGQTHALSDWRGRPVLVHFWATWCGVCKAEIGSLKALHRELQEEGRGEAILAVALRSAESDVRALVHSEGIEYPVLLATDDVGFQMKVQQFPTTYALDASGVVRARDTGWSPAFRLGWMLDAARQP